MRFSSVALLIVCLATLAQSEIQCEYPDSPDHGRALLVGDEPVVGSLVVYTCDTNWRLVGSATSFCADTGKWVTPKPRCVEFPLGVMKTSPPVRSLTSTLVRSSTSTPVPSPFSTPVRSPNSTPVGTPISTPLESPISTPVRSSILSPISTPLGSPISNPVANTGVQPSSALLGSKSNCTCTYINSDANLVAYANMQRLRTRDLVKDGYKIRFHCSPLGYYRLSGPSNITCRYCRTWFSSEYPKCVLPRMGDPIIRIQGPESVAEFPGGYLGVPEGSVLRLICLRYVESNGPQFDEDSPPYQPIPELFRPEYRPEMYFPPGQPEWDVLFNGSKATPNNTVVYNQVAYEHGTSIQTRVFELSNVKRDNNNIYQCAVRRSKNMSIEVQAITPDASCPEFNQNGDFTVHYDKGQSVNSRAVFSCKKSNERIVGFPSLTCMSNGRWSADPPQCMKICPKLQETEGMLIHYSNFQETDSTANFQCQPPRMLRGVSYTRCKSDGQWADPVPTCEMSLCLLSDLFSELSGNIVIITGETMSDTVHYNFSLRLNCASNGRMSGMSETVRCGLDGMWEVGDPSKREKQRIFTGPESPTRYGTPPPSLGRPPRLSSYGGPRETPSFRIWYETCFGNIGPSYSRGRYSLYSRPSSTTKRPKS